MITNCYTNCAAWGWRRTPPVRAGLRVILPPAGEQITLAEAKNHLRVDDDGASPAAHPDDALIEDLIVTAREWCENETARALVTQTFELTLSAWPASEYAEQTAEAQILPMSPVASVEVVTYLDGNGAPQILAPTAYTLADWMSPARLYPAVGSTWPTPQAAPDAIVIEYVAGYTLPEGSPNNNPLPRSIKQAMLLVIAHLYDNRAQSTAVKLEDLPLGVYSLLDRYRLRLGVA